MLAGVCAEALYEGSDNEEALLAQALEYLVHGSGSADSENTDGLLFDEEELGCALRDTLQLLRANWPLVDALAAALLTLETLDSAQLLEVRNGPDGSRR